MKTVFRLCVIGILCLSLLSCQDEEIPHMLLFGQKISSNKTQLNWTNLQHTDGFKIWRIVKRDGVTSTPQLLASVDSLTFNFMDEYIPLSTDLTYYITTSQHNQEIKSNEVHLDGATSFNILPYQMKLLPENKLAVVRGYSDVTVINYDERAIVKRKEFPGKVGTIDIASFDGKKELYVPCSDQNVYICDPTNLTILDTLRTSYPVSSVAVTSNGIIFASGGDYYFPLKLYSRSTMNLIAEYPGESESHIILQSDTRLLAMSSHIFPATMSFYTLTEDGGMLSKADDPYFWEYDMENERLKVSDHYIVTSNKGVVYTADDNMTYVTELTFAGTSQSDFEFSQDGKSIFSAITNQRVLYKSTISGNQVSTTSITTQGYPWILARDGNKMIILSSPDPFSINFLTNKIIVETVSLN
ncbi:MAG: hypothetical protein ABI663_20180 [Chryseolinea sp.]